MYRFLSRLLDYYYEGPPPLIFTCIGFNFIRTSKGKQKVILQTSSTGLENKHKGLYESSPAINVHWYFSSVYKQIYNELCLTRKREREREREIERAAILNSMSQ